MRRSSAERWGVLAARSALAAAFLLPLIWMAATAARPVEQSLQRSLRLLPAVHEPREDDSPGGRGPRELSPLEQRYWSAVGGYVAQNFVGVWNSPLADFPTYLRNSLIVVVLSVTGMVASSAIVAFGFSRLTWPGRDALFVLVLATMMVPFAALMAPSYLLFKQLGWIGTLAPLWAPAWCGGAFSIFLLRQFFLGVPREIDEAAMIDGCSPAGVFARMILPLSRPALALVALLQFVASWNDFLGPLVFLNHEETYTLPLGLQMFQQQHGGAPWNLVMMATLLIIAPVAMVFLLAQRAFLQGVAIASDKQ